MPETLFFVSDDSSELEELAAPYRDRGWGVEFASPSAGDAVDRIAETKPLAAVFCLDGACFPSTVKLAQTVLTDPRRMRPLMVFLGGDPEQIARAKTEVSVGLFVTEAELPWVLKHLAFKA